MLCIATTSFHLFVSVSEISLTKASTQMQLASSLKSIIRCMGWAPYVDTFPDTVLCSLLRPFRHVSVRTFLCMGASSVLRINCKLWSESSNTASCSRAERREDCWMNALHALSFSCDCQSEVIQIIFFSVLMQFIAYSL